jgi:ribosomal protein L11 methyltransferase
MCLRVLRRLAGEGRLAGARIADYGTGSGVLGIAALLYGARQAVRVRHTWAAGSSHG